MHDYRRRDIVGMGIASFAAAALSGSSAAQAVVAAPRAGKALRDFSVDWSDDQLDTLRTQIKAFRFPRPIPGSGWKYGMDADYLRALVAYWADGFDMAAAACTVNRYPQFVTRVEDLDIHFIRVIGEEGPHKAHLPLVLTHGWPGSTFEFWDAIGPLAFPSQHSAAGQPSFDLIIPSLPGHGPSGKPARPLGARTTARLWSRLMRENLGYDAFYAQGGDWGAGVTGWLGLDHPDAVRAIHLNLMIVGPQAPPANAIERKFYENAVADEARWGAYYQMQATDPQSVGYAMTNDPVAQAAWLIQRFYQWCDRRTKPFERVFTMDQLLTNVMIYVMNDAFLTSTWFYTGSEEERVKQMPTGVRVRVPTGYASYSGDTRSPTTPRSIVEKGYNLVRWADVPRGGHFAAMEEPDLYVRELRAWATQLRL